MAIIESVNVSRGKGERKQAVGRAELRAGHGIVGDGHAGDWHRQVSLLARESIEKMQAKGLEVGPGDFAENITTAGIDLLSIPVGTRFRLGAAILEVTRHGKECHAPCEIYHQAGDCVMPSEGIFAIVVTGGHIRDGDEIIIDHGAIPGIKRVWRGISGSSQPGDDISMNEEKPSNGGYAFHQEE